MPRIALKIGILLFAVLSLTGLPYILLGIWNRLFGGWQMVFFCYAGSRNFVRSYGLPGVSNLFRWVPVPIGVLQQDERWGLVIASSATEADFTNPQQAAGFARLQRRIARIARWSGTPHIHLAGILPSLIGRDSQITLAATRPQVVAAVHQAVQEVARDQLPKGTRDVIVLGGAGFIGRALVDQLRADDWACHVIDPKLGATELPSALRGRPALLLDVARKGAIAPYIPQMWPGLVVLNEVFPAPSRTLVAQMLKARVSVFHLAGVAGRVIPPLPHGYEGAVPCCASRPTEGPPQVVIRQLSHAGQLAPAEHSASAADPMQA